MGCASCQTKEDIKFDIYSSLINKFGESLVKAAESESNRRSCILEC